MSRSSHAGAGAGSLPPDEHIAEAESRFEVIDGERVYVPPARETHAREHAVAGYVVAAHLAPGYAVAVDLLTRVSETSDYAPDLSVYPAAPDPETGGRQLEELAFEIVSKQSMAPATRKAQGLIERGVRRVFCLDIRRADDRRALEWIPEDGGWRQLPEGAAIEDRCFIKPIPIAALLGAAADEAVAGALIAKHNPVIEAAVAGGHREGVIEGQRQTLRRQLARRFGPLPAAVLARLDAASSDELERYADRLVEAVELGDVFDPP